MLFLILYEYEVSRLKRVRHGLVILYELAQNFMQNKKVDNWKFRLVYSISGLGPEIL